MIESTSLFGEGRFTRNASRHQQNWGRGFPGGGFESPPAAATKGGFKVVQLAKIQEVRSEKERRLLQRKAKLESDLARLRDQEKKAARRDDTRRKIVLGGALLKAMDSGTISDEVGRKLVSRFVADRDKKLFEGSPLAVAVTGAESSAAEAPDSEMRE